MKESLNGRVAAGHLCEVWLRPYNDNWPRLGEIEQGIRLLQLAVLPIEVVVSHPVIESSGSF